MTKSDQERYLAACHAMQTGVALEGGKPQEPKHLRVGVNVAMCDHAALVRLLVEKGIIDLDDYARMIADQMEQEVEHYKERLRPRLGDVDLH